MNNIDGRLKDNIKLAVKEIGCGGVWIRHPGEDSVASFCFHVV
jgi:hypothetical protein